MPLELLAPPALVQVRDHDGQVRAALLLARRDGRCYLQVSRGAGDNVLRWLPSTDVRSPSPCRPAPAAPSAGEPHPAPVRRRPPRSLR